MNGAVDITYPALIFAYGLSFLTALLMHFVGSGQVKDFFIALARCTVQLTIMGFFLEYLFKWDRAWLTLAVFMMMALFASRIILQRSKTGLKGIWIYILLSVAAGGGGVICYFLFIIVKPDPFFNARYVIPLAGMIMGNSMNGSALALDRYYHELKNNVKLVETKLSLGASPAEAAQDAFQSSFRSALTPMLSNMAGMGLVFLPGMMTGQILGGSPPLVAIKYQLAIMLAISASVAVTSILILKFASRRLFTPDWRLQI